MNASQQAAPTTFAQRLRAYREAVSLSLAEVGAHVGVSAQAVHKWETEETVPSARNLLIAMEMMANAPIAHKMAPASAAKELLMAELIIVTMINTLTDEQKANVQAQLSAAGVAGADPIRSQERRAAIIAGGAA